MSGSIKVEIATGCGSREVDAYPIKDWPEYCVHKSENYESREWVITHIPTGCAFPYYFYAEAGAISAIEELANDIGRHVKTKNLNNVVRYITKKRMKRFVKKWLEGGLLKNG